MSREVARTPIYEAPTRRADIQANNTTLPGIDCNAAALWIRTRNTRTGPPSPSSSWQRAGEGARAETGKVSGVEGGGRSSLPCAAGAMVLSHKQKLHIVYAHLRQPYLEDGGKAELLRLASREARGKGRAWAWYFIFVLWGWAVGARLCTPGASPRP